MSSLQNVWIIGSWWNYENKLRKYVLLFSKETVTSCLLSTKMKINNFFICSVRLWNVISHFTGSIYITSSWRKYSGIYLSVKRNVCSGKFRLLHEKKSRGWRWTGHVALIGEVRNAYRNLGAETPWNVATWKTKKMTGVYDVEIDRRDDTACEYSSGGWMELSIRATASSVLVSLVEWIKDVAR
jgi:hypothetical protein